MEIKIGEYVRTPLGIAKYLGECDDMPSFYKFDKLDEELWFSDIADVIYQNQIDKVILKHSPNIIDLIEVGDIIRVKGLEHAKEVIEDKFFNEDIFGNDVRAIIDDSHYDNYSKQIKDYKILSVVTHEQFEEMEYKV